MGTCTFQNGAATHRIEIFLYYRRMPGYDGDSEEIKAYSARESETVITILDISMVFVSYVHRYMKYASFHILYFATHCLVALVLEICSVRPIISTSDWGSKSASLELVCHHSSKVQPCIVCFMTIVHILEAWCWSLSANDGVHWLPWMLLIIPDPYSVLF